MLGDLFGDRRDLIVRDLLIRWARWYLDGIVDPQWISDQRIKYAFLYRDVKSAIENEPVIASKEEFERREIVRTVSNSIFRTADSISASRNRRRAKVPRSQRTLLLDIAGVPPRCWICGSRFSEESVEKFVENSGQTLQLPDLIDILTPRGLNQQDLQIEVDHVIPFSLGGLDEGNQRLACGWCNRHKGAYISIYDVSEEPLRAGKNVLGLRSLPRPFWIVRMLAFRRRCESLQGCEFTSDDGTLFVSPVSKSGAMNPSNLRLVCREHDPFRRRRWQSRRVAGKLWGHERE